MEHLNQFPAVIAAAFNRRMSGQVGIQRFQRFAEALAAGFCWNGDCFRASLTADHLNVAERGLFNWPACTAHRCAFGRLGECIFNREGFESSGLK